MERGGVGWGGVEGVWWGGCTQARLAPAVEVIDVDDSASCASTAVDEDLINKTLHSNRQGALCDLTGSSMVCVVMSFQTNEPDCNQFHVSGNS
jgi:hypothetical protein